jgi:hypothetical protein
MTFCQALSRFDVNVQAKVKLASLTTSWDAVYVKRREFKTRVDDVWRANVLAPRLGREFACRVDAIAKDGILAHERAPLAHVGHRGAVGEGL